MLAALAAVLLALSQAAAPGPSVSPQAPRRAAALPTAVLAAEQPATIALRPGAPRSFAVPSRRGALTVLDVAVSDGSVRVDYPSASGRGQRLLAGGDDTRHLYLVGGARQPVTFRLLALS